MSHFATIALAAALLSTAAGCGSMSSPYMTKLETPQAVQSDASQATVVFIRPSTYGGKVKQVIVDEKGRFLGETWGATYFVAKVPPGEHTFISWCEGTPALKATLEAGKVYYVEIGVTIGAWSARGRLFADGPSRKQWGDLPSWLHDATMLVPNEAAGQQYLQSRQSDLADVLNKGTTNYAGYDGEEKAKRTLTPSDGVPAPIAAK